MARAKKTLKLQFTVVIVAELKNDLFNGFEAEIHGIGKQICHAYLLTSIADLDTHTSLQGIKSLYHGYYGCPYCLVKGEYLDYHVRYTIIEGSNPVKCDTKLHSKKEFGVQYRTILQQLKYFEEYNGFSLDAMHAVFLIFFSILKLWIGKDVKKQAKNKESRHARLETDLAAEFAPIQSKVLGKVIPMEIPEETLEFGNLLFKGTRLSKVSFCESIFYHFNNTHKSRIELSFTH